MSTLTKEIEVWIQQSQPRIESGEFKLMDLEVLKFIVESHHKPGQQLLYLYTKDAFFNSEVVAWTYSHELASNTERPYLTVKHAIDDGWRVIGFPPNNRTATSGDVGLVGAEFILEKLEL